ncbi:MAG: LCP family protein, partial [Actinomycetota bacterium]
MADRKPTAEAVPAATSDRPPEPGQGGGDGADPRGSRRRFILRQVGFAVAGVLATLLAVAAVASIWVLDYIEDNRQVVNTGGATVVEVPGEPVNVLVLGSDSRARLSEEEQATKGGPDDVEGQRSDTIILAHFDPERNSAVLVHFPRDLRVEIPGHGEGK